MSTTETEVTLLVQITQADMDMAVQDGPIAWLTGRTKDGTSVEFWISKENEMVTGEWIDVPLWSLKGGV